MELPLPVQANWIDHWPSDDEDPLWVKLRDTGFTRVDQVKFELSKPHYLANLFDSEDECLELVKGLHGFDHRLHEVVSDAEALKRWKDECQDDLDRLYRYDRQSSKHYCLRPKEFAPAPGVYAQLLGIDVKLQCNVSKSTYRAKLADPSASKQDLENTARAHWLKVLTGFLVEAQLPICEIAQQTTDPNAVYEKAFGSRRMRTLRSRARAWKKVANWLIMFKGKSYPTHVSEMLDYMIFLQQEGTTRGQVDGVCAALSVIEDAGQVPAAQKISGHRLWLQSVKSLMSDLDNSATPVRRAPPLSVAMVLALEVMVADEDQPLYARALA